MPTYYDDPEVKRLFEETYPREQGYDPESIWNEQNRANNPPEVIAPSPGEQWLRDYTGRTGGGSGVDPGRMQSELSPGEQWLKEYTRRTGGSSGLDPGRSESTTPLTPAPITPAPATGLTPDQQKEKAEAERAERERAQAWEMKQREAAENERRNRVAEKLAQDQFDLEKAKADALEAYNKAMLQYNDRRLAQEAFDASVLASWRNTQTNLQAQQTMLGQQLQGARIVVEQRAAQQDRRRRRPFAPRPRVSVT